MATDMSLRVMAYTAVQPCTASAVVDQTSMGLLQPPRISLSEGIVTFLDQSDHTSDHQQPQTTSGSIAYSADFEFQLLPFGAAEDSDQLGCCCSSHESLCCADKLFSNGRILPLNHADQQSFTVAAVPSSDLQQKLQRLAVSDHACSDICDPDISASVSKRWTDAFRLKKPPHSYPKDKHNSLLWFLPRSRSTSDSSLDPNMSDSIDPWLGRSASDSTINRFRPTPPARSSNSRRASAKPVTRAAVSVEAFRSHYSQVLPHNDPYRGDSRSIPSEMQAPVAKSKPHGLRISSSPVRSCSVKRSRASDSVDGRAGISKRIDSGITGKHAKSRGSSRTVRILDVKTQKQRDCNRGSGSTGSYQVAPVLHMQMCMSHSFISPKVSKARLAELCHLNFLKKHRPQRQNIAADAIASIS